MTDKVQLIKQDIESYKESMKGLEPHSDFRRGQITAYNQILQFIDSLSEEPKKQPKFRVGDTIKGPCNNVFQVKEVLDKQYLLHSENGDELNSIEIVDKYSCLEEHVSDDLEEEINNYIKDNFFGSGSMGFFSNRTKQELNSVDVANIARHFAEWQKDKMNLLLQTEYEKGLFDMREEIMKNTVLETEVLMDCDGDGIETPYEEWLTLEDTEIRCVPDGFKDGDIVKVILVKEDLP